MDAFIPRYETSYAVRVSLSMETLPADFVKSLLLKCQALVACEHKEDGKRTHIHFALYNSSIGHDPLRKYIKLLLKDITNLDGNSLLSVKKYDCKDKYLIYIIKGKNPFIINTLPFPFAEWERLRSLWVSESSQENDYSAWKASKFYPTPIKYTLEQHMAATGPLPAMSFQTVQDAAVAYALDCYGGFVNAKVRYVAKDLISNYCLFNKIKMLPVYI